MKTLLNQTSQDSPVLNICILTDDTVDRSSNLLRDHLHEQGHQVTFLQHTSEDVAVSADGQSILVNGTVLDVSQFDGVMPQFWNNDDELGYQILRIFESQGVVLSNPVDQIEASESKIHCRCG